MHLCTGPDLWHKDALRSILPQPRPPWGARGAAGGRRRRRRPGRCVERSRKEALGEDTASTACTSLHVCYFQLDGEQAKFSNRLSWELKSSSPPPRCPAPTACRLGESECAPGISLCPAQSVFSSGAERTLLSLPVVRLPHLLARPQDLTLLRGQRLQLLPSPLWAGPDTPPSILPNPTLSHHGSSASPAFASLMHTPTCSLLAFFSKQKISLLPSFLLFPNSPSLTSSTMTSPEVQLLLQPCPCPA